ncbi:MAG: alpha-glucan family phosphorylase [Deltaproteobacteria bacterium]|jgi:phosphorylase/glycogen(starch) synthase|nr:alpha-glucan family phosphorylase [Deltaproteobacteria bacterium]
MKHDNMHVCLFEVSWEVCNKVGGIYTVVSSKALQAVEEFGEEYYMLGPDLKTNADFEETDEACWDALQKVLHARGLKCRLGRWRIPGEPKVILVDFAKRYNTNQILYDLWERCRVDSLAGGWDYIEPVMFSTACAEVISAAYQTLNVPMGRRAVAQFHEWMCGAGLLNVKKIEPEIGTVFTTHATMLGRALAGTGMDIYRQMRQINPTREAAAHNITPKCSMESISAREADCFTTVSNITGDEASAFLGRAPDVVTTNGMDMRLVPDYSEDRQVPAQLRAQLLSPISRLLRREIKPETRIMLISGRYEYRNKGLDLFLDALAGMDQALAESDTKVLALFTVMGGHTGINPAAVGGDPDIASEQGPGWYSSHHVWEQPNDPILNACKRLGLHNNERNSVQVVFIPAQLDGKDGFLNMRYEEVLAAADLGVFPSWYEPWGYTPHESAAFSVPTATTDLSGFGIWAKELQQSRGGHGGVTVLPRRNIGYDDTVRELRNVLLEYATCPENVLNARRKAGRALALGSSWENFFPLYIEAYTVALNKTYERAGYKREKAESLSHVLTAAGSTTPLLRYLTAVAELPRPIERLRELANNLWWAWHPESWSLFEPLDPDAWARSDHNPIHVIESADPARLQAASQDPAYLALYDKTMAEFDAYMAEPCPINGPHMNPERPIAYFSTEYGLHECLTIYSGGLGVLSGDHLKSASDLNLPFVAVGLLYKNGYFRQYIDKDGRQIANYPENDFSMLPVNPLKDANGAPVIVELDMPGRQLYAQAWIVRVGRVSLYLLDTDISMNIPEDRKITARLYEADRDVRLRQEIVLGIGGVRLLRNIGLRVAVYHINEGHSAFMVLDRVHAFMVTVGLSYAEASEMVRSNTVFTTHTPVDAGNERFAPELMERYFTGYASGLGLSWQEFMGLGRVDPLTRGPFEMTVLALNFSCKANGVSRLHGLVSRHMWRGLWKGVPISEVPIDYVTNGIHVPSYVGPAMRPLLDRHLGEGWMRQPPEAPVWDKVNDIPDEEFWNAKQVQKKNLLDVLRNNLYEHCRKFGLGGEVRRAMLGGIVAEALVIGFARRFAPYKRATLIFADPDRLAKILNNPLQPVILVFAGKAHPADQAGIDLIRDVVGYANDPRFRGRIFFIEDYCLAVSRGLSQGCDVWLNNPRRPYEASGTSGQKLPVNGGLNLSISDGWWCEGYSDDINNHNGWTIGPVVRDQLPADGQADYSDAESLYTLLEDEVVPLFFERPHSALPHSWIALAKNSLRTLTAQYSSDRMVRDYFEQSYLHASARRDRIGGKAQALARHLAAWKQEIPTRFATLRLCDIQVVGLHAATLACGQPLTIHVRIDPGQMQPDEILAQLVIGIADGGDFSSSPEVVRLAPHRKGDSLVFSGTFTAARNGRYAYGIRVMPTTAGLDAPLSNHLVLWG